MNRQRSLLGIARPVRLAQHGAARPMVILTVALVIGLPLARPFTDAIGLPQITNMRAEWLFVVLRALCGVVVIAAAAVAASMVMRGVQWLIVTLSGVSARPPLPVALSLVTAGPICMLASLLLPMYMGQLVSGEEATVRVPLLASLLAVATFLGGAVLVGVGLWASVRPHHTAESMTNRPASELDKSIFNVLHARSPHSQEEGLGFGEMEVEEARR